MTNQELCTQYELLVALIETGNSDKAVAILKDAVKRIKFTEKDTQGSNDSK
ncbi:MAG: hypothetical protein K2N56_06905 [Oscillospiraceae bacterium]|nr:hypothetical protein [Oscillospiraceae bacterium]